MQICKIAFADIYKDLYIYLHQSPVDIECRNKKIKYEMCNVQLMFTPKDGTSVYSHENTRAFPINFATAEFVWILSGSNNLDFISKYNKAMIQYSDDGETLFGAYGYRLQNQIDGCINKLIADRHSRQAVAIIYDNHDIHSVTRDLPCNTQLQFMIRDNQLNLTVTSRSSDFMTGLLIDAYHWQLLLVLVRNQLAIDNYPELEIGYITYNIASLHVYDVDAWLIEECLDFNRYDTSNYNHMLYLDVIDMTYSITSILAKQLVDAALKDIYNTIVFTNDSMETINKLKEIFKNRKNKIVKNENN